MKIPGLGVTRDKLIEILNNVKAFKAKEVKNCNISTLN